MQASNAVRQLKQERASLAAQISRIDAAIKVLGGTSSSGPRRRTRRFSAATIAKMRRSQKARWAKVKGKKG
jgi:hypothetical protein